MDTAATNTVWRVTPWNKGKLPGQKPPLKLKEIWAIGFDYSLIIERAKSPCSTAIESKLRGYDLVGLRVHDVVQGSRVAPRAIVLQTKTQRPVQFEITEQTRDAIAAWITEPISNRSSSSFRVAFRSRLISRPGNTLESSDRGLPRLD
jgi:hypothetical protein